MPNGHFAEVQAEEEAEILSPVDISRARTARAPPGLLSYLAALYETPILSREQERHLFRKYNYLKSKASRLRDSLNRERPSRSVMREIERLHRLAVESRNVILTANLRLAVSCAKRFSTSLNHLMELVSDNNMSLVASIEKFDFALNYKFSTYATWAIRQNSARDYNRERRRQDHYHGDKASDSKKKERTESMDVTDDHGEEPSCAAERREEEAWFAANLGGLLGILTARERFVIELRFGLYCDPLLLDEVG